MASDVGCRSATRAPRSGNCRRLAASWQGGEASARWEGWKDGESLVAPFPREQLVGTPEVEGTR